jgi:hypothetical protein
MRADPPVLAPFTAEAQNDTSPANCGSIFVAHPLTVYCLGAWHGRTMDPSSVPHASGLVASTTDFLLTIQYSQAVSQGAQAAPGQVVVDAQRFVYAASENSVTKYSAAGSPVWVASLSSAFFNRCDRRGSIRKCLCRFCGYDSTERDPRRQGERRWNSGRTGRDARYGSRRGSARSGREWPSTGHRKDASNLQGSGF